MRKLIGFVLILSLLFVLTACRQDEPNKPVDLPQPDNLPKVVLEGDSYWTAVSWDIEGDKYTLPTESWWLDLTLWSDGSARIRDVENDIFIGNEEQLDLNWIYNDDGSIALYSRYSEDPYWVGSVHTDGIDLEYYGGILHFDQSSMPQEAGDLYCPAELSGVWMLISGEIEGSTWDAIPGQLGSLVFKTTWVDDQFVLTADEEQYDSFIDLYEYSYDNNTEVLSEPLYSGCGNEKWSVRIGEKSPVSEYGFPINKECYVTLLDRNTLLQQTYFSYDGEIPVVSYQTYKRILPQMSDWEVATYELEGSDWECVGYVDAQGVEHDMPPGIRDFYVHLDLDTKCWWSSVSDNGNYSGSQGNWSLYNGGTLLLHGDEYTSVEGYFPAFWYAGAVRGHSILEMDYEDYLLEMYLYYDGGIMKLAHIEGSGGENYGGDDGSDYAYSMNFLEGNAFSAPADALLVMYGDSYLDMSQYTDITAYYLADGPGCRQLLITAVMDETAIWVENDNFVVGDLGTLSCGESAIIQLGIPESEGPVLWFIIDGMEYYFELDQQNVDFQDWWYVVAN